jgi:enoyl-CoA hydratase/long-chain 3-hydroxyacyl-CoA dehydrogenase
MDAFSADYCIFTTNVFAIYNTAGAKRPEQIIGMHYFSPVPSISLLEVIPLESTSDTIKAAKVKVGLKEGKTCIEVRPVLGF